MLRAPDADPPDALRARLAEVEEKLRYVEQAVPLGLWDWDLGSGQITWSEGLHALYGLAPGGFEGTADAFLRRVHPDDRARLAVEMQSPLEKARTLEFRIVRADGEMRWLSARAQPVCDAAGRMRRMFGLNLDVTDARLREQELRLRDAIIDNMAEGVHMVSARTARFVYTNPRFEQLLGFGPGELVGQPVAVINSPSVEDPLETARRITEDLRRDGFWQGLILNRRKDGRDIWMRATVSHFEHELHGPVWVNTHADVNEEQLTRREHDRISAELNRLAGGMQQAIEAERAALARDVHDQLGAALTAIRLRLQALASRAEAGGPVGAEELLAIAGVAQAASTQTREICSRLRPPALDHLGLVATCRWHLDEWAAGTGAGAGITVRRRLRSLSQEPPGALAIDVFRTLQELLTNVARHAQAKAVTVSLQERAGAIVLRVADDGRGFPPREPGRGLGLVGVRERAQRHGGEVQVQTGPGGATVTARFPLQVGGA